MARMVSVSWVASCEAFVFFLIQKSLEYENRGMIMDSGLRPVRH